MDPLAKAYLKVLTEASSEDLQKGQDVKGYKPTVGDAAYGDSESDSKVKNIQKGTGPEAEGAGTLEKAKEADAHLTVGKEVDGEPKSFGKNYAESTNPFDKLFNKIISEEGEVMDFATSENPEDSSFEPSFGDEGGDNEEFGDDEEEGEGEDEVTVTLDRETAKKLHEALSAVLEEGEDEESEEGELHDDEGDAFGGGEDEEEGVEGAKPFGEATDMEEWGTPLVDQEKLEAGMNKSTNYIVKGAVPVKKKSAQTPATGKGHDGKIKSHSTEGGVSKLTSKGSVDVGGVKPGKFLFDNE